MKANIMPTRSLQCGCEICDSRDCGDEYSSLLFGHTPSAGELLPTFRKSSLPGEAA